MIRASTSTVVFGTTIQKDPIGRKSSSSEVKIDIVEQAFPSTRDAVEFGILKKELDHYKMHAQILQQKNLMLEEQLEWVTNTFEELKKEVDSSSVMNSSIDESDGQYFLPSDSFDDCIEFDSTVPWGTNSMKYRSNSLDQVSHWSRRKSSSSLHIGTARSKSFADTLTPRSTSLSLIRRRSDTSESPMTSSSSFSPAFETTHSSPAVAEVCQHFLKGRCRYKSLCKYSHDIIQCPYCKGELPLAKIAASTHLSRCFKVHSNPEAQVHQ